MKALSNITLQMSRVIMPIFFPVLLFYLNNVKILCCTNLDKSPTVESHTKANLLQKTQQGQDVNALVHRSFKYGFISKMFSHTKHSKWLENNTGGPNLHEAHLEFKKKKIILWVNFNIKQNVFSKIVLEYANELFLYICEA